MAFFNNFFVRRSKILYSSTCYLIKKSKLPFRLLREIIARKKAAMFLLKEKYFAISLKCQMMYLPFVVEILSAAAEIEGASLLISWAEVDPGLLFSPFPVLSEWFSREIFFFLFRFRFSLGNLQGWALPPAELIRLVVVGDGAYDRGRGSLLGGGWNRGIGVFRGLITVGKVGWRKVGVEVRVGVAGTPETEGTWMIKGCWIGCWGMEETKILPAEFWYSLRGSCTTSHYERMMKKIFKSSLVLKVHRKYTKHNNTKVFL